MCTKKGDEIYERLLSVAKDAKCELEFKNNYELIVAVVLSAQTTDKRVNMVTKELFTKFPEARDLANASYSEVEGIIHSVGLSKTKAKNIIELAEDICTVYGGVVPDDIDSLMTLPGVGRKTASVVLIEGFKKNAVPVDTHVYRAAKRIGISNASSVSGVEQDIWNTFSEDKLGKLHHMLIYFGRNICSARNPKCEDCPFKLECRYENRE